VKSTKKRAKKRRKKIKLSPELKALRRKQKLFRNKVRKLFLKAGFQSVPVRDKQVTFCEKDCEFDFVFVYENIIVIAEDTVHAPDYVRDHLLKKDVLYKLIASNKDQFVDFLGEKFPEFNRIKKSIYNACDCKVIVAYCTKEKLEDRHKKQFGGITFLEDRHLQYFLSLANILGQTMRFELLKFFDLETEDIGVGPGNPNREYDGFILPESPSGFPAGYKIVTFYIDPATLMEVSYVLRKDGWMDGEGLYQRMIGRSKIRNMRQYLAEDKRVFINNVIVSLPSSTKVLDSKKKSQIDVSTINKTTAVAVQIPVKFNSIGIIDGQHRIFAYHEGSDEFEDQISIKRQKQQLLVTGVVYPDAAAETEHREFEARLFLEINDKQTRTKADLRQAIESIVNPFSVIAIARSVISKLSSDGPLCGILEEHQFDKRKLKSSSIVSYGIRHIVKCEGEDSLFKLWAHNRKSTLARAVKAATLGKRDFTNPPKVVLDNYIEFCAGHINNILTAYKRKMKAMDLWTMDQKVSRAITTTAINGTIFSLRRLIEENRTDSLETYFQAFDKLAVDFRPGKFKYKSSHWNDLGSDIVKQCFNIDRPPAP
jgi:DGQHR domain-containing protein